MNEEIIAEIILTVIIILGLVANCIMGVVNLKALRKIEESKHDHKVNSSKSNYRK